MDTKNNQESLFHGAVLASVGHAVYVCRAPDFAAENSWDGQNYNVQDSQGSRGTISFHRDGVVGAFFMADCDRDPFRGGVLIPPRDLLEGAPKSLRDLAESEAFQYLLQEYDGETRPIVTAAFWGESNTGPLCSIETWPETLEHGACLVELVMLGPQAAMEERIKEYRFSKSEVELIWTVFGRRMAEGANPIDLTPSERDTLRSNAISDVAWDACRESFAEIDILTN